MLHSPESPGRLCCQLGNEVDEWSWLENLPGDLLQAHLPKYIGPFRKENGSLDTYFMDTDQSKVLQNNF